MQSTSATAITVSVSVPTAGNTVVGPRTDDYLRWPASHGRAAVIARRCHRSHRARLGRTIPGRKRSSTSGSLSSCRGALPLLLQLGCPPDPGLVCGRRASGFLDADPRAVPGPGFRREAPRADLRAPPFPAVRRRGPRAVPNTTGDWWASGLRDRVAARPGAGAGRNSQRWRMIAASWVIC